MGNRYWYINGKQIHLSNQMHNTLNDGRKRTNRQTNLWKENIAFSINDEQCEKTLYEHGQDVQYNMEQEVEMRLILKEAFTQLSPWEQHILYQLFYEQMSMAEIAKEENVFHTRICREKDKALIHLREILKNMGIYTKEEFYS